MSLKRTQWEAVTFFQKNLFTFLFFLHYVHLIKLFKCLSNCGSISFHIYLIIDCAFLAFSTIISPFKGHQNKKLIKILKDMCVVDLSCDICSCDYSGLRQLSLVEPHTVQRHMHGVTRGHKYLMIHFNVSHSRVSESSSLQHNLSPSSSFYLISQ